MSENKWAEALELFKIRKEKDNLDNDKVNSFCWSASESSEDKVVLKKCVDWMKKMTDKQPTFEYLDTYARLLYKVGSKKLSKTVMARAIQVGKSNKEDTKDNEEWLKNHK